MYYSYLMGLKKEIFSSAKMNKLKKNVVGIIKNEKDAYGVCFTEDQINNYEKFVINNLKNGFWNEYVGEEGKIIVFIFKFNNGEVKRFQLDNTNEQEILKLCSEFAKTEFTSIRKMILDNDYYSFYGAIKTIKDDVTEGFINKCADKYNWYGFIEPFVREFYDNKGFLTKNSEANKCLNKLTIPQKNLYLFNSYIGEVMNGGHHQFYLNSSGILWEETLIALKEMNLDECYKILNESIQILNPTKVRDEICDQLEKVGLEAFEDLDTKFYDPSMQSVEEKVKNYVKSNINEFIVK